MKKIVAVVGPTASGKSALALELAKCLEGEIVSCDSMQVYKKMNIGTAKPTEREMREVAHHLIDVVEPDGDFSCADYVRMATEATEDVLSRGKLPIFCGGTGLYLDAFLRGTDFETTEIDEDLRRELEEYARVNGNDALHNMLREIDPESADAIHKNNVKRVIRAIEIYKTSGKTKTELDRLSLLGEPRYDAVVIGLRYNNRELLSKRIDARVDVMIENGLLDETRELYEAGIFEKNTTATQAIGYKEMLGFIRGDMTLDEASECLKSATRKYAKRQMTWFRQKPYVVWIDADGECGMRHFDDILSDALAVIKNRGIK